MIVAYACNGCLSLKRQEQTQCKDKMSVIIKPLLVVEERVSSSCWKGEMAKPRDLLVWS